jgi:hypothetical protein
MTHPGTVTIEREVTGMRDRLRDYRVMIDGQESGRVAEGEAWSGKVEPGSHQVFLKLDWCRSPIMEFEVTEGQIVTFRCRPGGGPFSGLPDSLFRRNRYIALTSTA